MCNMLRGVMTIEKTVLLPIMPITPLLIESSRMLWYSEDWSEDRLAWISIGTYDSDTQQGSRESEIEHPESQWSKSTSDNPSTKCLRPHLEFALLFLIIRSLNRSLTSQAREMQGSGDVAFWIRPCIW